MGASPLELRSGDCGMVGGFEPRRQGGMTANRGGWVFGSPAGAKVAELVLEITQFFGNPFDRVAVEM